MMLIFILLLTLKILGGCAALLADSKLRDWYACNGMLLHPSKSEAILVGVTFQLSRFPHPLTLTVAEWTVECKDMLVSLGVTIDSGLSWNRPVGNVVSSCDYHLQALRHIRSALSDDVAIIIGRAIILSRLDYCSGPLVKTSKINLLS